MSSTYAYHRFTYGIDCLTTKIIMRFLNIVFTVVALAFLLSVKPHNAARFLEGEKKENLIENHQPCARFLNLPFSEILPCGACCGYSTDCACSPFSQKNHQPVFSLSFFLKKTKSGWYSLWLNGALDLSKLLVLWRKDPPMVRGGGS